MFPDLTKFSDPEKLRKLMINARRLGHEDYAFQIQMRIAELTGLGYAKGVEREFWTALAYAEEVKTQEKGKSTKLSQARQKFKKLGAVRVLNDWAMEEKTTDGFASLVDKGRAELTGEAIVVRHAEMFSAEAVSSAATKLAAHGITRESVI